MLKRTLFLTTSLCLALDCYALELHSQSIEASQTMKPALICSDQHGGNQSPQFSWTNVPKNTKSLVLISHDPDAKLPGGFVHWVVYINNPAITELKLNQKPTAKDDFVFGLNDSKINDYYGPCPPKDTGVHHYNFTLYALDKSFDKATIKTMKPADFVKQLSGHTLAQTVLTGLYQNQEGK